MAKLILTSFELGALKVAAREHGHQLDIDTSQGMPMLDTRAHPWAGDVMLAALEAAAETPTLVQLEPERSGLYHADVFDRAGVIQYAGLWSLGEARERWGDLVRVLA